MEPLSAERGKPSIKPARDLVAVLGARCLPVEQQVAIAQAEHGKLQTG
eukprot:CAMPEP_0174730200 /NCGR_PEP_ID=MMETSP1094-20130205/55127_1 /TAXON_ID=156173 /ORGANISM="Chrysochromulina brevifilum, Strain UTEX LB 985" /LENGTH=47 /DNA_ID= /DNA_START= /DNA_END= /DNA_ORIENTATION=